MLYDIQTTKWRQVASNPPDFGYLAWSHDSAYIYFDSSIGFYRLRVADAHLEKLFSLNIQRSLDQFGSSWSGLGLADEPLFVRDISAQEIYALDLELP